MLCTDSEQQQLLHAAQIIQNAFRKYKVSVRVVVSLDWIVDWIVDWTTGLTFSTKIVCIT